MRRSQLSDRAGTGRLSLVALFALATAGCSDSGRHALTLRAERLAPGAGDPMREAADAGVRVTPPQAEAPEREPAADSPELAAADGDTTDAAAMQPEPPTHDAGVSQPSDPEPVAADAGLEPDAGEPEPPALVRLEPLGDSITAHSCVTLLVNQQLRDQGFTNFDLVGTQSNPANCGTTLVDRSTEGHSGYLATDLVGDKLHAAELRDWTARNRADVVMMHLGTNDIWHASVPPEQILAAFSEIVSVLRGVQPQVKIFVAQIIPIQRASCTACTPQVPALNALIPAWAARESSAESPVYVVDQFSGFDAALDTTDGVHPTLEGARKLANRWVEALLEHDALTPPSAAPVSETQPE